MAAKKKATRRKARKPKFIEVEGHKMTPGFYAGYQVYVEERTRTNPDGDAGSLGLADFLSPHRPSSKIKKQLLDITQEAISISLAIGAMRDYTWYNTDVGTIRAAGCDLVKKLALDLYNTSAKITVLAMNVEAEETTKLQDWLAADERVARIGKLGEITHGNR
jgi:hypothetical protein